MHRILPLLVVALFLAGCGPQNVERQLTPPTQFGTLDTDSQFLKAHMLDGRVYVLRNWRAQAGDALIAGGGELYDINRNLVAEGVFEVQVDSVALFETNALKRAGATIALTAMTVVSATVTMACLANPKACFGSCPTFFLQDDAGEWQLLAEGFSSSIAPSLEATDIDALARHAPRSPGRLEMRMTNEALETHVVRRVDLLAVPLDDSGRCAATPDGRFRRVGDPLRAVRAMGPEGDCLTELATIDGLERISLADSTDLATPESIDLEFDVPDDGEWGLVLGARQSLMTTFLFYQGLAYMGDSAIGWLARLEAMDDSERRRIGNLWTELGGIEVAVRTADRWEPVTEVNETGPLAIDYKVVELPRLVAGPNRLRLTMARGMWRLDHAALVRLGEEVQPLRLEPASVRRHEVEDPAALAQLLDDERSLVTLPGDDLTLVYELPDTADRFELFLESRGYYLEWIREEWIAEEDPVMAARMLLSPRQMLRDLAPAYKAMEPGMESMFWGSRYAHP